MTGIDAERALALLSEFMSMCVGGTEDQLVEDYLLPLGHPLEQQYYRECVSNSTEAVSSANASFSTWGVISEPTRKKLRSEHSSRSTTWARKHVGKFEKLGMNWFAHRVPDHQTKLMFPGLFAILPREFEVLASASVMDFPETKVRIVECSQGIDFSTGGAY